MQLWWKPTRKSLQLNKGKSSIYKHIQQWYTRRRKQSDVLVQYTHSQVRICACPTIPCPETMRPYSHELLGHLNLSGATGLCSVIRDAFQDYSTYNKKQEIQTVDKGSTGWRRVYKRTRRERSKVKRREEVTEVKGNGDGMRLDLGWCTHSAIYKDVLWNCTLKTCIILLTNVAPINPMKIFKKCFPKAGDEASQACGKSGDPGLFLGL